MKRVDTKEAQRGEGAYNRTCIPGLAGPGGTCHLVKHPYAAPGVQHLSVEIF